MSAFEKAESLLVYVIRDRSTSSLKALFQKSEMALKSGSLVSVPGCYDISKVGKHVDCLLYNLDVEVGLAVE